MATTCVALTTLSRDVRPHELAIVAAALQKQVSRDFAPAWGADAIIVAVPFEAIPSGAIPIIVHDSMETEGANGLHRTEADESPYCLVPFGQTWSLAASHALLTTLANPCGSARAPGPSPLAGQGVTEYLLDVCAPCQDIGGAYAIDGVVVSDFCTRAFYGAFGSRFSFTGTVDAAFEPASGGLVTWLADDGLLYQKRSGRVYGGFSVAGRGRLSIRELVDLLTPERWWQLASGIRPPRLEEAGRAARRNRLGNETRYRDDIAWRFGCGNAALDALHRRLLVQPSHGLPLDDETAISERARL